MQDSKFPKANVNVDSGLKALDVPRLVRAADSEGDSIGLGQAPYPVEWSKLSFDKKLTRKKTRAKKYKAKVLVPYQDDYQEKEVGLTLWHYTNLQPLWVRENEQKSDHLNWRDMFDWAKEVVELRKSKGLE